MDMETRMPEVYDECVVNRNEAINILNIKSDWSYGLIFSVLYRDDMNKVQVITAVGIKNSDECGPQGQSDSDEWINTYYINALDAHGSVFYRIIGDSGSNTTSTNESGDFHTTTVTVNGAQYKVLNASEDSNVTDAFKVQEL